MYLGINKIINLTKLRQIISQKFQGGSYFWNIRNFLNCIQILLRYLLARDKYNINVYGEEKKDNNCSQETSIFRKNLNQWTRTSNISFTCIKNLLAPSIFKGKSKSKKQKKKISYWVSEQWDEVRFVFLQNHVKKVNSFRLSSPKSISHSLPNVFVRTPQTSSLKKKNKNQHQIKHIFGK